MIGNDDIVEQRGDDAVHDPDDVRRILRERAQALAVPRDQSGDGDEELHLLSRVGDHAVAIPAARARHVVTPTRLTQLVGCGPAIVGLAVIHGGLVPVADLGLVLGADGRNGRPRSGRLVVVDDGQWSLGLLVDHVEEMLSFSPDEVRDGTAPGAPGGSLVAGVARGGTFVLDIDQVLADDRLWPVGAAPDTDDDRSGHDASGK